MSLAKCMCFFSCAQGGALARQVEEMLDGILQQMSNGLLARVCTINCTIRSPGPLRPGPVGLGYDQAEPGRVTCTTRHTQYHYHSCTGAWFAAHVGARRVALEAREIRWGHPEGLVLCSRGTHTRTFYYFMHANDVHMNIYSSIADI